MVQTKKITKILNLVTTRIFFFIWLHLQIDREFGSFSELIANLTLSPNLQPIRDSLQIYSKFGSYYKFNIKCLLFMTILGENISCVLFVYFRGVS